MKSQPATAAVPLPSLTTLPLVSELTGIDCMYGPTVVPWYTLEAVRAGQPLPAPAPDRFGRVSPCCSLYSAIWLRRVWTVLRRLAFFASLLAELNCGMTIAARMPRMITTIRISIRVKPFLAVLRGYMGMLLCVFGERRLSTPTLFRSDDPYGA